MTTSHTRFAVLLSLAAAACAHAGRGGGEAERIHQADFKPPTEAQLSEDAERGKIRDAASHYQRGRVAQESGNMDQARAEFETAADGYAGFADQFASSEWRLPVRSLAAELYMQASKSERAGDQAQKIIGDPAANQRSKAFAAHLGAGAWLSAANAKVKAGQLEPIKLQNADQRRGELKPRVPPGEWKRYIDTADVYAATAAADPEPTRGLAPPQIALIAAEIEYAFDNMEDARRRFDDIIQRYPQDPDVLESAVPLYLQTYLYQNDEAGYQAAVQRLRAQMQANAQKATDPKAKEAFAKVQEALGRAEAGTQFTAAQKLLDAGKPAEAAVAFEKVAQDPKGGDVANALHNAAVAWDKAGQPQKAATLRERIVTQFGDSKVAPNNQLLLAVYRSKKGEHGQAAKLYEQFLQRWPDSPNRCVALQNVASELDLGKKHVDAAQRYLAFGRDASCSRSDPNTAARALYRAGRLFQDAKQRAKAKEAYVAAGAVPNVTDTVAKSQVEDARRRAKEQ